MRICLVKTSSMGDVIHTLPALTDAQKVIPNLQVDWVVEEAFAEIPRWHSAVNQVIPIALRRWRKQLLQAETWQAWRCYRQALQAEHYDAVIDAQGLVKSALFASRLAQGKKWGYDRHSIREPLASFFYDETLAISYQQHAIERIRQLFAKSLGYVSQGQADYGIAHHFAKFSKNPTACILCFHATTRAEKHWPEEAWFSLFKKLVDQGIEVRLPWNTPEELARAERLATLSPLVKVLPKMNLTALAEQINQAWAVVSVDTGLSHLAAALNKPNVILYGATDPQLIGAYGENQHYLFANSMADISAEQVYQKLISVKLLQNSI